MASPEDDSCAPAPSAAASAEEPDRAGDGAAAGGAVSAQGADDIYRVRLEVFEGPLDLLLHLIEKHELDIFDIPVSFVTGKYLEYLAWMQTLQIDVASEYLVMAATLAYIKSRLLLPDPPAEAGDEEGGEPEDPRAELVRRLLEYQKYKHAANQLADRSLLDRDVFERGMDEEAPAGPAPFAPVSPFKLFEAFEEVLRRAKRTIDHEVIFERVGIAERMVQLTELLADRGRLRFDELFEVDLDGNRGGGPPTTISLVLTLLALLEMARLGVARVVQDAPLGDLAVEFSARPDTLPAKPPPTGDEADEDGVPTFDGDVDGLAMAGGGDDPPGHDEQDAEPSSPDPAAPPDHDEDESEELR